MCGRGGRGLSMLLRLRVEWLSGRQMVRRRVLVSTSFRQHGRRRTKGRHSWAGGRARFRRQRQLALTCYMRIHGNTLLNRFRLSIPIIGSLMSQNHSRPFLERRLGCWRNLALSIDLLADYLAQYSDPVFFVLRVVRVEVDDLSAAELDLESLFEEHEVFFPIKRCTLSIPPT